MPTVRAIQHEAAANDHRFSSFIMGIVNSQPFQMREVMSATEVEAANRN
jgi:hypothetical protein